MPAAPAVADYYTFAAASILDPTEISSAEITITNLVRGTNVLAVEVHQQAGDNDESQNDVAFDTKFRAALALNISTPPRPRVSFVRNGGVLTITWNDPAYRVQSATNVTGAWVNVVGSPVSPYNASIGGTNGPRRFYRLSQ